MEENTIKFNPETITIIDSGKVYGDNLSYFVKSNTFSVKISELKQNINFDENIIIENIVTGQTAEFKLRQIDADEEGEVKGWRFVSVGLSTLCKLLIINS